jgi:hypothetical protein
MSNAMTHTELQAAIDAITAWLVGREAASPVDDAINHLDTIKIWCIDELRDQPGPHMRKVYTRMLDQATQAHQLLIDAAEPGRIAFDRETLRLLVADLLDDEQVAHYADDMKRANPDPEYVIALTRHDVAASEITRWARSLEGKE